MRRNQRHLINASYKTYAKWCRYATFPYYFDTETEKYLYGTITHLESDTPYTLHKVEQFDTWDSLASFYYGNPTLYWVLCDVNKEQDPFKNPEIGSYIKIPALSEVKFEKLY